MQKVAPHPATQALRNLPQAFTRLALITACYHLDRALNMHRGRTGSSAKDLYD